MCTIAPCWNGCQPQQTSCPVSTSVAKRWEEGKQCRRVGAQFAKRSSAWESCRARGDSKAELSGAPQREVSPSRPVGFGSKVVGSFQRGRHEGNPILEVVLLVAFLVVASSPKADGSGWSKQSLLSCVNHSLEAPSKRMQIPVVRGGASKLRAGFNKDKCPGLGRRWWEQHWHQETTPFWRSCKGVDCRSC